MASPIQSGVGNLESLALGRFGALSPAEIRLVNAVSNWSASGPYITDDHESGAARAEACERSIRAELIRWFCADRRAIDLINPTGIWIKAVTITGTLDLSFSSVPFPLRFEKCSLEDLHLESADLVALSLAGSSTRSIWADNLRIKRELRLSEGFQGRGLVSLTLANIEGNLNCAGGSFINPAIETAPKSGVALNASGARIKGFVLMRNGFSAQGAVKLYGAQIDGDLDCNGGTFTNPASEDVANSGLSLQADLVRVNGSILLRLGFSAQGLVRLYGARIAQDLDCEAGTFVNSIVKGNRNSSAVLTADLAKINGCVLMRNGYRSSGLVTMYGAQLGGDLDCTGGIFENPVIKDVSTSGTALSAVGVTVAGRVLLRRSFKTLGEVFLYGAKVGGDLNCSGSFISNSGLSALNASNSEIGGSVLLNEGFHAEGIVQLINAKIAGNLECNASKFANPPEQGSNSGFSLKADGVSVNGYVLLRNGFNAAGSVKFYGSRITGDLDCSRGTFGKVDLRGATVGQAFIWRSIGTPASASLDLSSTKVADFRDDLSSWPSSGNLILDGFVYNRISEGPKDSRTRLEWLRRQTSFTPQPYRQLGRILKDEGDDRGARRVLYEMERRRREASSNWSTQAWSRLLEWTIGYGYYPGRAIFGLLLVALLGWPIYSHAHRAELMAPTNEKAYATLRSSSHALPDHYPSFHPLVYSADNSFPLVKLGQNENWGPDPHAERDGKNYATFVSYFRRFQILVGWLLATLFVAGVTGITKKD